MTRTYALIFFGLIAVASAAVVRPAPNVAWDGGPSSSSLRAVRGQPVVLVFAESARSRAFNKQLANLQEIYQQFASRQVVFVAVIQGSDTEVRSDIPFALARNPEKVAADFGVAEKFTIAIIGKDGNVDLQTSKVIPASRVRDVINNSFEVQADERKQQ